MPAGVPCLLTMAPGVQLMTTVPGIQLSRVPAPGTVGAIDLLVMLMDGGGERLVRLILHSLFGVIAATYG